LVPAIANRIAGVITREPIADAVARDVRMYPR
jgi:hypothetical protein